MCERSSPGSLVCVGVGMMLGGHLTPRSRQHIVDADVVFAAASDPLVELWIGRMHADVRSLQPYYAVGTPRDTSYRAMVAAIVDAVQRGQRVCAAFYGHPGVFARVAHDAIAAVRARGLVASMEPGISAEDCLYADLGIDPGDVGCQHYEASQFMAYRRRIDPSACLVLWQVGMAGDLAATGVVSTPAHRALLVGLLAGDYALDHQVIVYEAATSPLARMRAEHMALAAFATTPIGPQSTLVVPPAQPLTTNREMLESIRALGRW